MKQYHELLEHINTNGRFKSDRTGTGTTSIFGYQMRFDLTKGFPLITTKKIHLPSVIHELIWFLSGSTNIKYLTDNNVKIWNAWAITIDDFNLTADEKETLLKNNEKIYKEYIDSVNFENCAYVYNDNVIQLSKEDLFLTGEMYLNKCNVHKTGNSNFQNGDLGAIYSAAWKRAPINSDELVLIDKKIPPLSGPMQLPDNILNIPVMKSTYSGDLNVLQNNNGIPYVILEDLGTLSGKNTIYKIQFVQSKFISTISRPNIRNGVIAFDPYHPTLYGVAAVGCADIKINPSIYGMWYNMIARCYNKNNPAFKHYGERGVYVSPRWLLFENFIADLPCLINYEKWAVNSFNYNLDKDYFGTNCYDVKTTLFLHKQLNHELSQARNIELTFPNGDKKIFLTRNDAIKYLGVNDETFRNYENKVFTKSILDGIVIEDFVPPENKLLRKRIYIDQISEALNLIKSNPDSRRIIISAWIPDMIPSDKLPINKNILNGKAALPPCHALFQFYVENMTGAERVRWLSKKQPDDLQLDIRGMTGDLLKEGLDKRGVPTKRLSCQLYQRSADVFLGVPFNIASYALLTHMFAQQADMAVGDFIWTGGDCHLYSNHAEQVKLQLSRTPKELPTLKINRKPESLFDYKFEDFEFLNYNPDEAIKAPVAV